IDRLPAGEKILLQRGSVMGRTFFAGAVDHLSAEYDADELEDMLDDLLLRDLITRQERSTITGETAYRFKHVLIREVAYGGLSKSSRAEYHTRFAEWLREKAEKELLEIRAYHLDQACILYAELDGHPPEELAKIAAKALHAAGKRALARESNQSARKLQLAGIHIGRMEEDKAEPLIDRALELAEHSGSIVARASAASSKALLLSARGDYEAAAGWYTKALELYREAASVSEIAWTSRHLGIVAWRTGETEKAEKLLRESSRLLAPMQERGTLCESQRYLAQLLLEQGRVDEAEKFALAARETVSPEDTVSRATTRVALAQI